MAVYTELSSDDFRLMTKAFGLGEWHSTTWVPEGSINTNAFVETSTGRYFVRHTTVRSEVDLEFEAGLLRLLKSHGVPAARMLSSQGRASQECRGGRVCVFECLEGKELTRAEFSPHHARILGRTLARFHLAARGHLPARSNPYSQTVVDGWLDSLRKHPDSEVSQVAQELSQRGNEVTVGLPLGVIHGDLFLDNVKWPTNDSCVLFDFEMACHDEWLLDLAITLNAWCFDDGKYQKPQMQAFVAGYEEVRNLIPEEKQALASRMETGAIRFTASRIRDFHLSPMPKDKLARKDYRTYLTRVRSLRALGARGVVDLLW